MRSTSDKIRLTANSYDEIEGEFMASWARLRATHRFGGEKLRAGHLLNAVVLRFVRLPKSEQAKESLRWLAELEIVAAETDEERESARKRIGAAAGPKRVRKPKAS